MNRWRAAHGLPALPGRHIPATCEPAVGASREALGFQAAVEDFAKAAPPAPYGAMIDALGSSKWAEREAASKALEAALRANPGDARWLFAARRHRDPEVRLRCNTILRRLNPCGECHGTGQSGDPRWPTDCRACDQTGRAWPYSPWD